MRFLRSERQGIEAEITRVTNQDLSRMSDPALLMAGNEAQQLLIRIDQYRDRLRKKGVVAQIAANVNDAMTVVAGSVWGASLLGVAIAHSLAIAAAVATPLGAAYVVGDRVRRRIRKRRVALIDAWYIKMKNHLVDFRAQVAKRLLHPE
jgi:hypothetical protein